MAPHALGGQITEPKHSNIEAFFFRTKFTHVPTDTASGFQNLRKCDVTAAAKRQDKGILLLFSQGWQWAQNTDEVGQGRRSVQLPQSDGRLSCAGRVGRASRENVTPSPGQGVDLGSESASEPTVLGIKSCVE